MLVRSNRFAGILDDRVLPLVSLLEPANLILMPFDRFSQGSYRLDPVRQLILLPGDRLFIGSLSVEQFTDLTVLVLQQLVGRISQDTAGVCRHRRIRRDSDVIKGHTLLIADEFKFSTGSRDDRFFNVVPGGVADRPDAGVGVNALPEETNVSEKLLQQ